MNKKSKGNLNMIILMIMTIVLLGIIFAFFAMQHKNLEDSNKLPTKKVENYSKDDLKDQPMLGKKDAKITIVEFGDFKCPACKMFEFDHKPNIVQKYIDSGDAKFYFIHAPFHKEESLLGSFASKTVLKEDPEHYWDFHRELYMLQPSDVDSTTTRWLTGEAVEIALKKANVKNRDQIIKDIKNVKYEKDVQNDIKIVTDYGINATPTILIDGEIIDNALNKQVLDNAIKKRLKEK